MPMQGGIRYAYANDEAALVLVVVMVVCCWVLHAVLNGSPI